MSIHDNNMGSESHSVRMPELSGPIHEPINNPTNNASDRNLTMSQAETFPTWSSGRSRTSSGADDKALHTSNSSDSTTSNTRVAYGENTNTESAGSSAYDHGKDTGATATPSSSRSRSRSRGDYDMHRVSQDGRRPGFPEDTEAKHKKFISKIMDHKLAPSFLK